VGIVIIVIVILLVIIHPHPQDPVVPLGTASLPCFLDARALSLPDDDLIYPYSVPCVVRLGALWFKWHDGAVDALNVRSALVPCRGDAADGVPDAGAAAWGCCGVCFGLSGCSEEEC
jgi:hypothetical protein